MRFCVLFILTFLVAVVCDVAAKDKQNTVSSEQVHFSAEDAGVKRPVSIPKDVLEILAQDETVQSELEDENIRPQNIPSSWFSASAIHLTTSGKNDLVVVGQPPVSGGNVALFWIFSATSRGYRTVLMAPAHDLVIEKKYWNHYKEIELLSATAEVVSTVLCRFDGTEYKVYKSQSRPIQ